MSRLLCVVAAMLLVTAAMAQTGDFAETTDNVPAGLPISASATFKATVETYASVKVTPPSDLTIPGDVVSDEGVTTPGSDFIEPAVFDPSDLSAPHGGLVEVSANDTCYLQMQVTEFRNATDEALKSLVKVGSMLTSQTPTGSPLWMTPEPGYYPYTPPTAVTGNFVQVIDDFGGWNSEIATPASLKDSMPWGAGGTYVIKNLPINPSLYDFRYVRLFWGTKAYNRVNLDCASEVDLDDHVYETLAAKGDYVATVTATLTSDAL